MVCSCLRHPVAKGKARAGVADALEKELFENVLDVFEVSLLRAVPCPPPQSRYPCPRLIVVFVPTRDLRWGVAWLLGQAVGCLARVLGMASRVC